jgi:hypothetical protein
MLEATMKFVPIVDHETEQPEKSRALAEERRQAAQLCTRPTRFINCDVIDVMEM